MIYGDGSGIYFLDQAASIMALQSMLSGSRFIALKALGVTSMMRTHQSLASSVWKGSPCCVDVCVGGGGTGNDELLQVE